MELHFPETTLDAVVSLPSSKSISNRALILNALAYSDLPIRKLSDSDDTQVLLQALDSDSNSFDLGAAGTAMRFLTAFLAKTFGEWTLTGSERMKQRPIKILVEALKSLGAKIEYLEKDGFPPLRIWGSALKGGEIKLNAGVSSQYISALMMIAPYMQEGLHIQLEGEAISRPYLEMTARMMQDYGSKIEYSSQSIRIPPGNYKAIDYSVEGDWSAASYWYEVLLLAGRGTLLLQGLHKESYQGDSKVLQLFELLGIESNFLPEGLRLNIVGESLSSFKYDFRDQPDLAQTFAVCCCMKAIPFHFSGLQSLKIKESDRVSALITELHKLGFLLRQENDGEQLIWEGKTCHSDPLPRIATYEDHRMAMSFAPVALLRPLFIENPQVVSKSYPSFWEDLQRVCTKAKTS